jgi:hypothetical protein
MPNTQSALNNQTTPLSNAPFTFNEDRNTVFYHEVRVFIFGTDVTPFLTGSVRISRCDVDGVSSCSFSLSNQYRVLEITPENIADPPVFRGGTINESSGASDSYAPEWRASESAKRRIIQLKKTKATNLKWSGIQSFGPGSTSRGDKVKFTKNFKDASKATSATVERYPFNVGSLVFHKNDPVRVFVKNPFSRDAAAESTWTCEFTGYLTTKPYNQDYINGQSLINVTASDIRDLMKYMRTQLNPSAQVGSANTLKFRGGVVDQGAKNAGFHGDQISGFRYYSHILAARTWFDSVKYLLFGTNKDKSNGVCNLTAGETVYYDPKNNPNKTLASWNDLVTFGETRNFLTYSKMLEMGMGTYFGGKYSPDNAKVHFLVPKNEAPNSNLISYTLDSALENRIDFETRYNLLHTLCTNIDYQMYVTGIGDLVFEFPMYDFLPSYFGDYYSSLYSFDKHLINDNINDESGQVCTAVRLQSDLLFKDASHDAAVGIPLETSIQYVTTVFSNILASRVGVVEELITRPGLTDPNRRTQVAMIEFMKRLANFSSFEMISTYRPFLNVNRPMFHLKKKRFGIANKVEYTFNLRSDVTVLIDLNFVRKEEGDGKYRFITGGEAMPISYSTLYGRNRSGTPAGFVPGQGVASSESTNEAPTNNPSSFAVKGTQGGS